MFIADFTGWAGPLISMESGYMEISSLGLNNVTLKNEDPLLQAISCFSVNFRDLDMKNTTYMIEIQSS